VIPNRPSYGPPSSQRLSVPNRRVPKEDAKAARSTKAAKAKKQAVDPEKAQRRAERKAKWHGRWRSFFSGFQLVTGMIVVLGASLLVAWGLRRYMRTSPRFAIQRAVVQGNQRLTPRQIIKRGGLDAGSNVFAIDEDACARSIEAHPWVASAKVRTELPNRVSVEVIEREARLAALIERRLYLVDTKGELFKQLEESDPSDLPVVTGIAGKSVANDREGVRLRMRRIIDMVAQMEQAKLAARYPIQEVHAKGDGGLKVILGSAGIVLEMGAAPYRLKIAKASRILGELRYRKVAPDILFLGNRAHPEKVVVRLRGEEKLARKRP
jgi:cell division protein FtsQ